MTNPSNRLVWADNARVAAAFAVVFVHVAASSHLEVETPGTLAWWVGVGYDAIGRWCVTVFVLLSGHLLLDPARTEPVADFYRRRASRILVPLIFWSCFYTAFGFAKARLSGEPLNARAALDAFLAGTPTSHLWYLYMLLGLYACVPFIRYLMRVAPPREIIWLALGMLLLAVLNPLVDLIYRNPPRFSLFTNLFLPYIPVFVLGHYLGNRPRHTDARLCILVILISAVVASLGHYLLARYVGPREAQYPFLQHSLTILPMSFATFELLRQTRKPFLGPRNLTKLADLALGIYLIHRFGITLVAVAGIWVTAFHPILSIPLVSVLVFSLSAALTWLLRALPLTKRLV
jgi:surface polysaccharide O-acyltransferase-like enzyme